MVYIGYMRDGTPSNHCLPAPPLLWLVVYPTLTLNLLLEPMTNTISFKNIFTALGLCASGALIFSAVQFGQNTASVQQIETLADMVDVHLVEAGNRVQGN